MTLQEIKEKLDITSLQLNTAKDANDVDTLWMRHWENETRTAVSIHKELVAELQSNSNLDNLGLQKEMRDGEQGAYTAYRIVKYNPAETVL
jgi:hypothetical protein